MKKSVLLVTTAAALMFMGIATRTFAGDKEVTITGEAKCAKCQLKEGKECQNAVQVTKTDGKKETYYLTQNDASKAFEGKLCTEAKKVKVTGTVKEVDGKMQLAATKIELAQ